MLLEYTREFIALASNLNFTETARSLGLTQPTLSRHMADLERGVGCALLRRNPVELTAEGSFYLENVSPIIAELDAVLEEMQHLASKPRQYQLSFAQPVSSGRSAQICSGASVILSNSSPSVNIVFKEHTTASLVDTLKSGEVDCGFIFDPSDEVECSFIYSTPPAVCLRKDNPLADKHPLYLRDLKSCTLNFSSDKTYGEWQDGQRRVCRIAGFEPRFSLKTSHHIIDFAVSNRKNEVILTDRTLITSSAFPEEFYIVRDFDDDPPIEYVSYLASSPSANREAVALLVEALRKVAESKGLNTDESKVSKG